MQPLGVHFYRLLCDSSCNILIKLFFRLTFPAFPASEHQGPGFSTEGPGAKIGLWAGAWPHDKGSNVFFPNEPRLVGFKALNIQRGQERLISCSSTVRSKFTFSVPGRESNTPHNEMLRWKWGMFWILLQCSKLFLQIIMAAPQKIAVINIEGVITSILNSRSEFTVMSILQSNDGAQSFSFKTLHKLNTSCRCFEIKACKVQEGFCPLSHLKAFNVKHRCRKCRVLLTLIDLRFSVASFCLIINWLLTVNASNNHSLVFPSFFLMVDLYI